MIISDHPVRVRRLQLGLSQQRLADAAGVNRTTVEAIEGGRTLRPSPETVDALAAALALAPDDVEEQLARFAARVPPFVPKPLRRGESVSAWRGRHAASPTAFASLLRVNRRSWADFEEGVLRQIPRGVARALSRAGAPPELLLALEEAPR